MAASRLGTGFVYCCFKYYFKREEEKVSVFGPISKGDFERNTLILRDERRAKMMMMM